MSSGFFLSALFWEFLALVIFVSKICFLESNSKYVFKDRDFTYLHITHLFSRQINCGLIFLTFLIILTCLSHIIFLKTFCQASELPIVFNSVTSIECRTNHLPYFMDCTQLNCSKDATYS